ITRVRTERPPSPAGCLRTRRCAPFQGYTPRRRARLVHMRMLAPPRSGACASLRGFVLIQSPRCLRGGPTFSS
ncbi:hypothetical protein EXIGLDRAFT_734210, partial [Exidia glandulosa HHB12029]